MPTNQLPLAGLLLVSAVLAAAGATADDRGPQDLAVQSIDTRFLWRVGGDDEGILFGQVGAAAVADDGTTYLLDRQLSEVTAFDLAGREVARFGRAGEGPGEMQQGQDVMILGDGRIAVLNLRPPKLITFTPDGTPAGDLSLAGSEGMNFALAARAWPAGVVVQTARTVFDESSQTSINALRVLDPATGAFVGELLSATEERDRLGDGNRMVVMVGGGEFLDDWALFDDGSVAILRDDEAYEVEVLGADGTPRPTIRRDAERVRRPQPEVDRDIAQRRELAERAGWPFDADDIERLEPMVESLHPRPNGELWVLAGAGKAPERPDVVGVFDVFDADGRHVRQVELRAPYDPATDRFVIIGDALVVFENIVGTQRGVVVMGGTVAEEAADLDAEALAIARYRF